MTDSEYNLDANCLSRCSTELFSEASWEQVDKQDTEVSRRRQSPEATPLVVLSCRNKQLMVGELSSAYVTGDPLVPRPLGGAVLRL